jgi:2,4-dienoyl-CoA reductase (NADPH2)
MEAARVAALRGHEVTLFDKSAKLGGLLPIAAVVKGAEPEDIQSIVRYYQHQLDNLGVKVRLGKEAGLSSIDEIKPDAVVIAAGGVTTIPGIPGINGSNVIQGVDLHRQLKLFLRFVEPKTLRSLTRFYLPVGKRVVIIGSSLQGCELGEFLTKRGRKVTIVDTAPTPGTGMVDAILAYLLKWFQEKGVVVKNGIKEYVEITGKGLIIINSEGKKELIEADSIIPALPLMPNLDLMKSLEGKVPEVYAVGDCKDPQLIADAINAGAMASREI